MTCPAAPKDIASRRAIRKPRDEALRAPTRAIAGSSSKAARPCTHRIGGASGKSINAPG